MVQSMVKISVPAPSAVSSTLHSQRCSVPVMLCLHTSEMLFLILSFEKGNYPTLRQLSDYMSACMTDNSKLSQTHNGCMAT